MILVEPVVDDLSRPVRDAVLCGPAPDQFVQVRLADHGLLESAREEIVRQRVDRQARILFKRRHPFEDAVLDIGIEDPVKVPGDQFVAWFGHCVLVSGSKAVPFRRVGSGLPGVLGHWPSISSGS